MNSIFFKNAHVVTAGFESDSTTLLVVDGRISAIGGECPADARVVDVGGDYLTPGFIDVHCHGRNNMDFSDGTAEAVYKMAEGKLSEGVTTLYPTTLTLPEEVLAAAMRSAASYDNRYCRIPGVHLEGPYINPKCLGAQNPAFVRKADIAEVERLNDIFPVGKVTFAVEMPGGPEFTAALLERGIVPSCTHSAAKYADFSASYACGLRNLSHFCNQMSALHHRDIGLVGAGLLHRDVYAEFICDKLHICPEMIKLVFSVKGCDHVILVSDAMRAAGMPDGDYTLGGLPVVVSGGAARLKEGGALAGSTLKICDAVRNVREVTGLPLSEVIKSATSAPAAALGLKRSGKLEPGFDADIVQLDANFQVVRTLVGGEVRYGSGI